MEIDVEKDLVGNHDLMIKGRPVVVFAESSHEIEERILIGSESVPIIQTTSVSNGKITEFLIPIHKSEIDSRLKKEIGAISIREWKPKSGTEIIDNGQVLLENWTGNKEITLQSLPQSNRLVTSEGIPLSWKKQKTDGFWVKLTADVQGDAVYDPVDALFESGDIRELVDEIEIHFKFMSATETYEFFDWTKIQMEEICICRLFWVTFSIKKQQ